MFNIWSNYCFIIKKNQLHWFDKKLIYLISCSIKVKCLTHICSFRSCFFSFSCWESWELVYIKGQGQVLTSLALDHGMYIIFDTKGTPTSSPTPLPKKQLPFIHFQNTYSIININIQKPSLYKSKKYNFVYLVFYRSKSNLIWILFYFVLSPVPRTSDSILY